MFKESVHQQILHILNSLNSSLLKECQAYFGGGTQLVLEFGEYRQSRDIDFLCPFGQGYTKLRRAIFESGHDALFAERSGLQFPRDIRADQYGIRFPIQTESYLIRFEIVAEGRINFEPPQSFDWVSVACLSRMDAIAEKLLANSDRWADTSTLVRDLIDLAMLRLQAPFPTAAIAKAESAYPVISPLQQALRYFQSHPEFRDHCFEQLQIQQRDSVLNGIKLLAIEQHCLIP
jgi:hypothetical protein